MLTKPIKLSLNPEQEGAIAALLAGQTDQQVGDTVGVSRETVNRWRNHDPFFRAEYNRRLQEIWESNKKRLRALVGDAIETISKAVKDDATIALKIIQSCKDLEIVEPPPGPKDVEGILYLWAREAARQERDSKLRDECDGKLRFEDPFEEERELAPLAKKHFSVLKKKYGMK